VTLYLLVVSGNLSDIIVYAMRQKHSVYVCD